MFTLPNQVPQYYIYLWDYVTYPLIEPGRFMVCTNGEIYDIKKQEYKCQYLDGKGYKTIATFENGRSKHHRVHRIVAYQFCNPPSNFLEMSVNHIDGNKLNNICINLEWVTHKENMQHASESGLFGSAPRVSKITEEDVHNICRLLSENKYSSKEIQEMLDLPISTTEINSIRSGRSWPNIRSQYPDIEVREKSSKLPDEIIHAICVELEKGSTAREVAMALGIEYSKKFKTFVSHIRTGRIYRYISQLYNIERKQ